MLLIVDDKGCEARGGLALLPELEKRSVSTSPCRPAGRSTGVTGPGREAAGLRALRRPAEQPPRVHVRLPRGIPPGQAVQVNFHAVRTPPGWLGPSGRRSAIEFPAVPSRRVARRGRRGRGRPRRHDRPPGQARSARPARRAGEGQVRPGRVGHQPGLSLRESAATRPRWRSSGTQPRLTARTFSFFQIKPDGLTAHDELRLPRVRRRGRGGCRSCCPPHARGPLDPRPGRRAGEGIRPRAGRRPAALERAAWRRLRGEIRLAVDFQQPLPPNPQADASGSPFRPASLVAERWSEYRLPACRPAWPISRAWYGEKAARSWTCR